MLQEDALILAPETMQTNGNYAEPMIAEDLSFIGAANG
jgi:hypothetical protein